MLTDYHVHLRPDEDGSTAERYFTAGNVERYREAAEERGIDELGVAEHIHRFVQSLDVWQHPWYRHWAKDDLDEYCDFVRDAGLKLGIEADYLPGREDRVATLLDGRPWDFVVGSIHFLADEALDLHGEPDWEEWDVWRSADPDKVRPMNEVDVEFVEEPIDIHDLEGLGFLWRTTGTRLGSNQSSWLPHNVLDVVRRGAADVIVTDQHQLGGLSAFRDVAGALRDRRHPADQAPGFGPAPIPDHELGGPRTGN